MGNTVKPQPVKLFTGVLCSDASVVSDVRNVLIDRFGPIDFESMRFDFDLTNYYEPEMGSGIKRWFWSFQPLVDPSILPEVKHFTNELELKNAKDHRNRCINLDPGYLDFYKMVLASVKDRAQKIYLGQGIYADPTLYYLKGIWHPYDWSLPDFKQGMYNDVFNEIRLIYRANMRDPDQQAVEFEGFDNK